MGHWEKKEEFEKEYHIQQKPCPDCGTPVYPQRQMVGFGETGKHRLVRRCPTCQIKYEADIASGQRPRDKGDEERSSIKPKDNEDLR